MLPDWLLDIDPDLFAVVLHHPCDPLLPLDERTPEQVQAYFRRLCAIACACKTLANRHGKEAYEARLQFWARSVPWKVNRRDDNVLHLMSEEHMWDHIDALDLTYCCDRASRLTTTVMTKPYNISAVSAHYGKHARYEQVLHYYDFHGTVRRHPQRVAAKYFKEDWRPEVGVNTWKHLLAKLPVHNVSAMDTWARFEAHDKTNTKSYRGRRSGYSYTRTLRRGRIEALRGTTGEHEQQVLEMFGVRIDTLVKITMHVPGGTLRMVGSANVNSDMFSLNGHCPSSEPKEWHAEAASKPMIVMDLEHVPVTWLDAIFEAKRPRDLPHLGVLRHRAPRACNDDNNGGDAPPPPQRRCVESDSEE